MTAQSTSLKRQRGVVLILALIVLFVLLLSGLAIVRSVDTGNTIAGNLSFRQSALQTADVGIQAAFVELTQKIVPTSKDANIINDANIAYRYYALRQSVDTQGIPNPTGFSWGAIQKCIGYRFDQNPLNNELLKTMSCDSQDYKIKYIIERMCSEQTAGSPSVTNIQDYCLSDLGDGKGGSKGAFNAVFTSVSAVYYRATVQVTGPRNTVAYVQAIFSKGD